MVVLAYDKNSLSQSSNHIGRNEVSAVAMSDGTIEVFWS